MSTVSRSLLVLIAAAWGLPAFAQQPPRAPAAPMVAPADARSANAARLTSDRALTHTVVRAESIAAFTRLQALHRRAVGGTVPGLKTMSPAQAQAEYAEALMTLLGHFAVARDLPARDSYLKGLVTVAGRSGSFDGLESPFLSAVATLLRQRGVVGETFAGVKDATIAASSGLMKEAVDLWGKVGGPSVLGGGLGVGYILEITGNDVALDPFAGEAGLGHDALSTTLDELWSQTGGSSTTVTIGGGKASQESTPTPKEEKSAVQQFFDWITLTRDDKPVEPRTGGRGVPGRDPNAPKPEEPKKIDFNEGKEEMGGIGDTENTQKTIKLRLTWTPRQVAGEARKPGGSDDGKPAMPGASPVGGAPKPGGVAAPGFNDGKAPISPEFSYRIRQYNAFAMAVIYRLNAPKDPPPDGRVAMGFDD